MQAFRASLVLAALAVSAFAFGCDRSESVAGPDGIAPRFVKQGVDCATETHPSCPDGEGPGALVNLALAGAIATTAPGAVEVKTDNASTLELGDGGYDATFGFTAAIAPGGYCVTEGVFGDGTDGRITLEALLDLLTDGAPAIHRNLGGLKIDKAALAALDGSSSLHNLRHSWSASVSSPSLSGRIVTWIADPSFDRKSPVPSGPAGWSPTPAISATDLGGGSTAYTFQALHGIVQIKQLEGRPKDHPKIICPLLDDVAATVSPSP